MLANGSIGMRRELMRIDWPQFNLRIDVDGRNSTNGAYGIPANNPFV